MKEISNYFKVGVISIIIFAFEILGGIMSGSLALLADSGHVLIDLFAIGISIMSVYLVNKHKKNEIRKYGGYVNAGLLVIIAFWIFGDAYIRLKSEIHIESPVMIFVAFLGGVGNYFQHYIMVRNKNHNVTHRILSIHVLSDLLQSIGVVIGGIIIYTTGVQIIDIIISVVIGSLMLWWGVRIMWQLYLGHEFHSCHEHEHHH